MCSLFIFIYFFWRDRWCFGKHVIKHQMREENLLFELQKELKALIRKLEVHKFEKLFLKPRDL